MRQLNTEHRSQSERSERSVFCPPSSVFRHAQRGISLLTVALLLLLLGASLAAGIAYLRAGLPSEEIAATQRLALARADEAILGFASIHHRLPCPAATPNGAENCTRAKGYLPVTALGLDAMLYTPNTLTMRYMVYRNAATGDLAGNEPVTVADGSSRQLPSDKYDPTPEDNEVFKARNSLDMCETMRLAYKDRTDNAASYAHYKTSGSGAPFSVAYGLALPGAGDRSDNGDPFDGVNAGNTPEMEAPDRGHGVSYDDFVFVRDFPSLMSAFSCLPVDYSVSNTYTATVAYGSSVSYPENQLVVNYTEEGISSLLQSSVHSVKLAQEMVESSNKYFDDTRDSAKKNLRYGIWSSVNSFLDVMFSIASIATSAYDIVQKSIELGMSFSPPWFGVPAPPHAASVGSNVAALGFQVPGMLANIANFGLVLANTIIVGNVASRFGEDVSIINDMCENFNNEEIKQKLQEAKQDATQHAQDTVNDAKNNMDAAHVKLQAADDIIAACAATKPVYYAPFQEPQRQVLFGDIYNIEQNISEEEGKLQALYKEQEESSGANSQDAIDDLVKVMRESGYYTQEDIDEAVARMRAGLDENNAALPGKIAEKQAYIASLQSSLAEKKKVLADLVESLPAGDKILPRFYSAQSANACQIAHREITWSNWEIEYYGLLRQLPIPYTEAQARQECVIQKRNEEHCDRNHYYDLWMEYYQMKELHETAQKNYATIQEQEFSVDTSSCGHEADGEIIIFKTNAATEILRQVDKRGGLQ
ncbi:MAG: hypothetical protein LBU11_01895 [Zoogloeaceae bacterium]|jgi:hypothetical protein|nr:hypothetical protein [Zoogloeaceae bacterium]